MPTPNPFSNLPPLSPSRELMGEWIGALKGMVGSMHRIEEERKEVEREFNEYRKRNEGNVQKGNPVQRIRTYAPGLFQIDPSTRSEEDRRRD